VGLWVISCWNCYVEGAVVRAMMLGATIFGCGVEDYCVQGHIVGRCGVGCFYEGRMYVNNTMGGVFNVLNRYYCGTIGLCSLGTG